MPNPDHEKPKSLKHTEARNPDQLALGKDWLYLLPVIVALEQNMSLCPPQTPPEDRSVGQNTVDLFKETVHGNLGAYVQADIQIIDEKATQNDWQKDQTMENLLRLPDIYGISQEDLSKLLIDYQTRTAWGRGLNQPTFHAYPEDPHEQIRAHLRKFTKFSFLDIQIDPSGSITASFQPLYDGGIDDVAYPLHALNIVFTPNQPVTMDFEQNFRLWRSHRINSEFARHPELIAFLKHEFAGIVRLFIDNPDEFAKERFQDREVARSTMLEKPLYDYLDHIYLPKYLSPDDFRAVSDTLEFLETPEGQSVFTLKALEEFIFSQHGFVRNNSFFKENYAENLDQTIRETTRLFRDLGIIQADGVITDIMETVRKAVHDPKYARQILDGYNKIFHKNDQQHSNEFWLLEHEVSKAKYIAEYDIVNNIYYLALLKCRKAIDPDQTLSGFLPFQT